MWPVIAGIGASLLGNYLQGRSAEQSAEQSDATARYIADLQREAQREQMRYLEEGYQRGRQYMEPYYMGGMGAYNTLLKQFGLESPGMMGPVETPPPQLIDISDLPIFGGYIPRNNADDRFDEYNRDRLYPGFNEGFTLDNWQYGGGFGGGTVGSGIRPNPDYQFNPSDFVWNKPEGIGTRA